MQKVYFNKACVSFSSQTNYINTKKKLPGTILALHCCVESESYTRSKKNYIIEYLHDTFPGHFDVVNLAEKSIKSCLVKLQLRVAVSNVAH